MRPEQRTDQLAVSIGRLRVLGHRRHVLLREATAAAGDVGVRSGFLLLDEGRQVVPVALERVGADSQRER